MCVSMIQSFGPIADELQVDGDGWVPLNCSSNGNDDGTTIDRHKERNREHAKRTRLRKKELTEAMKLKLQDLQREVFTTIGLSYQFLYSFLTLNFTYHDKGC